MNTFKIPTITVELSIFSAYPHLLYMKGITNKELKPAGLSQQASFDWDGRHGYRHICVRCNKNQYEWGNMGLCYSCVREENKDVDSELKADPVQITLGKKGLDFLIEEIQYIRRSTEGARWYGARLDVVYQMLLTERRRLNGGN